MVDEKTKKPNTKDPNDFHPSTEYYEELGSAELYSEEKRICKIFGVKDKKSQDLFIRAMSKSKLPYGWRIGRGINLYNSLHVAKLIEGLKKLAEKLGWKSIGQDGDIKKIEERIREQQELIVTLQKANNEARENHELLMSSLIEKQKKLVEKNSAEYKKVVCELEKMISEADAKKIPEKDLQEFLYKNTWLFGMEYISAQPQKLRGAKSIFDFYLERFNKTNDIIEIKLLSDSIVNLEGTISSKVIQAVDQLIEYLESTIAAAHSSVISEEEGIRELRPRGIVIIGKEDSKEVFIKLQKWNYQMSHIKIMTYKDILERAKVFINNIEKMTEKNNKSKNS